MDIDSTRRFIRGKNTIYASRWLTDSGDQSANLAAAWASVIAYSGRVQFVVDPGVYALALPRNLLALRDNVEIILDGVEFTVDSGVSTTGWDLSATDTYQYDNAIFYAALPNVSDIVVYGGLFTIGAEELSAFQIGDMGSHTSGSITDGNIRVYGLRQVGGNQMQILSMDDVLVDEVYHEGTHSTAMNFSNSTNVRVRSPSGKRIGVSSDYATWNNTAAIAGKGVQGLTITSPRYQYTGGTAILIRASASKPLLRISTTDLGLTACGKSGIEYQVPTDAASASANEQLSISGGYIKGYQCAPSDTDHSGAQIAIAKTGGATVRGASIKDVQVDYCAPYETFNESTFVIASSYNTAKNAAVTTVGTTYGIQVSGNDADSIIYGGLIEGNTVIHAKNSSILADHMAGGQVVGNTTEWGGWGRNTGTGEPNQPAHGIYVNVSAEVDVSHNTIRQNNAGCVGSYSNRSQLIRCLDPYDTHIHGNNLRGNDTTVAASSWNHAPIGFSGSGFTLTGYTSRTCSVRVGRNNIYGTFFGLSGADGKHVARQSGSTGIITVYDDPFVLTTTATNQSVPDGVLLVIAARTTSTQTITLPDPTYCTGTKVTVKHAGLGTGLVTIATAVGTLWPALPMLANVGDYGTWQANGAVWEQIGGGARRWATVIPTDTPPLGTRCYISPPVDAGFIGWVYTSAGWAEFGVIEGLP
jgi:hypothetical protein